MKRSWALLCWLVLAGLAGCSARPGLPTRRPETTAQVIVTDLKVDFPDRERGELAFVLRLPASEQKLSEVSWELFFDGARFAAGIDGDVKQADGLFHVTSALASRHLAFREGEGWLDVVLEGEVDLGNGGERLRFRERRELVVHGRPQLNVPRD